MVLYDFMGFIIAGFIVALVTVIYGVIYSMRYDIKNLKERISHVEKLCADQSKD